MRAIRSGRGIGDNIYLQSIVRHLTNGGERLEVCTDWPDLFRPLGDKVKISPHRRSSIDIVAHYTERKTTPGTDQFQDCCLSAGISGRIDLRLDWSPGGAVIRTNRPIILVQMPREPFGRSDGYGLELLPDYRRVQEIIDLIRGKVTIVLVGKGTPLFELQGIDADLTNKTTIPTLLDLASQAVGFVGFCSFFVPLAEALSKPALFVWSRRGLMSREPYLRSITPKKIFHRASSKAINDDCSRIELIESAHALLEAVGSREPVFG
jgi:hypothetical protein